MNTTENLTDPPVSQFSSSPFHLLISSAPVAILMGVAGFVLVNAVLPPNDAQQFKILILGLCGGGGLTGIFKGAGQLMKRSDKLTDAKIANQPPPKPEPNE